MWKSVYWIDHSKLVGRKLRIKESYRVADCNKATQSKWPMGVVPEMIPFTRGDEMICLEAQKTSTAGRLLLVLDGVPERAWVYPTSAIEMEVDDTGFRRGDIVMVSDNLGSIYRTIYLAYIEGAEFPHMCVHVESLDDFKKGKPFIVTPWRFAESVEDGLETLEKALREYRSGKVK